MGAIGSSTNNLRSQTDCTGVEDDVTIDGSKEEKMSENIKICLVVGFFQWIYP